jgi:hypothetical protein
MDKKKEPFYLEGSFLIIDYYSIGMVLPGGTLIKGPQNTLRFFDLFMVSYHPDSFYHARHHVSRCLAEY